ncbi:hypothetical protein ACHAO7_005480 [Fusarium culmorum]
MSNFNVIIVGGGLAGPLLASGLLRKGVKVDLYERLEEHAKRDGYTIRVSQPCLQAFEDCLDADAFDQIKRRMGHFEGNQETTPIWYDYRMKPLLNMSRFSTNYHAYLPKDRQEEVKEDDEDLDFDNQTASFTFSMSLPTADCPPDILERDTNETWKFLSEAIPDCRDIIEVVRGQEIHTFRPRAAVRPSLDWRKNVRSPQEPLRGHPRVWLMGDAMHAMMPNRGMGGNQAMLDTKVIVPFLERLNYLAKKTGSVSEEAIGVACDEYEREMIPCSFDRLGGGEWRNETHRM